MPQSGARRARRMAPMAQPEHRSTRQTKVRADLPDVDRVWLAERLTEYRELLAYLRDH